ncbi:MAG TPA: efflux RND transporter permease subunit [Acidobacteriota bacterium]
MSLSGVSIKKPVATTMVCVGVILLGAASYGGLTVDLLPEIGTPRITLMTRAIGLSPLEVESLVTRRIETAVSGVQGQQRVTSVSREGMSVVTVTFPWGVDLDLAALHVRERVDGVAQQLPQTADRPTVLRWDPGSEPVMGLAVAGGGTLAELRELVEAVVVSRMEQVAGIAGAQVTGGAEREIGVQLDPGRLEMFNLTVSDVVNAIENANSSASSGTVLQGDFAYAVRVIGEFLQVRDVAKVSVGQSQQGAPLTIADLGTVVDGARARQAGALLNGEPAVGVLLYKESEVNTIEAVAAATEALEELRAQYPTLSFALAFENASFISESIDSVVQNITLGGLIALAVLFLFLKDPRNPILLCVSIPVSLIATFVLCYFTGITLNIMTLGGLALGVGMLVDNSIVVLENIFRLRQLGAGADEAAERGASEVAMAITASTLTTVAVFLPIAYVQGVAGELFAPQAWTVTFSLMASLIVALTVLPMLAARFMRLEEGEVFRDPFAEDVPPQAGEAPQAGSAPHPGEVPLAGEAPQAGEAPPPEYGEPAPAVTTPELEPAGAGEATGAAAGPEPPAAKRRRPTAFFARLLAPVRRSLVFVGTWAVAVPLFWLRGLLWLLGRLLAPLTAAFGYLYDGFARLYHDALDWCLHHRAVTVLGALALMVFGGWVAWHLPFELMPPVNTGRFEVRVDAPPGTPFSRLEQMVRDIDAAARSVDGVESTFATVGLETATSPGAASGATAMSPTRAFVTVVMGGTRSRSLVERQEAAMEAVRGTADRFREATIQIDPERTPLQMLMGGESVGFRIALRGDDLDVLDQLAAEAAGRLREVPGLDDVLAHNARGNPEIRLAIDRDAVSRYGVPMRQVTDALVGALEGALTDTQFAEFDRRIDIRVSARSHEEGLNSVLDRTLPTANGPIPMRELVHQQIAAGPTEITHTDRLREIGVTATLTGIRLSEAIGRAEAVLAEMSFPPGYRYVVAGEQEAVQSSFRSLMYALGLAALLVYMVMAAQFESIKHPFVILVSLPLGWVGVVLALRLTGQSMNVVALIGGVVLTGIIVNDAIVKIDTINRLRREGMPLRQAVLQGSALRLRPIVMTSVTTTCALIPMALGLGAGAELQRPLAIAIIGGESTGTLLTLLVIPVIYELLDREKPDPSAAPRAAAQPA